VNHIGLPNLVAEKAIALELIQKDVNPQRIAEEAFRILKDPLVSRKITESMDEVRHKLGEPGAAERAARIVCSMLQETKS
jgi:lipid-A-disaccharide synthase